jgi:hypothetical protein
LISILPVASLISAGDTVQTLPRREQPRNDDALADGVGLEDVAQHREHALARLSSPPQAFTAAGRASSTLLVICREACCGNLAGRVRARLTTVDDATCWVRSSFVGFFSDS